MDSMEFHFEPDAFNSFEVLAVMADTK